MVKHMRQGDVLFIKRDHIPVDTKRYLSPKKDKIIVEGEATGHAHRLQGNADLLSGIGNDMFVHVFDDAEVVHEEHGTVELDEGIWEVIRQKEYALGGSRTVAD